MKHLSPQEILVIHARIIDATGGAHGIRDVGLLISATERPKAVFSGKELYPSVFDKAAACFDSLARHHVFVDGNKRTAFAASARFLFLNGYETTVSNKEVEKFVLRAVEQRLEATVIADWLRKHSQKK